MVSFYCREKERKKITQKTKARSKIKLTLRISAIESLDKNLGYRTSSLTMLSKTSSSSSPGKGLCYKERKKKNSVKNLSIKFKWKQITYIGRVFIFDLRVNKKVVTI